MVFTRHTEGLGVETPDVNRSLLTEQLVDTPFGGEKVWSKTWQWKQPLRSLDFDGEVAKTSRPKVDLDTLKSHKDELFTGRHGSLPLLDFDERYASIMSDTKYKFDKYDKEYELFQLPCHPGDEFL